MLFKRTSFFGFWTYRELLILFALPLTLQGFLTGYLISTHASKVALSGAAVGIGIYWLLTFVLLIHWRQRLMALQAMMSKVRAGTYSVASINGTDAVGSIANELTTVAHALHAKTKFVELLRDGSLQTTLPKDDGDKLAHALVAVQEKLRTKQHEDEIQAWTASSLNTFVNILQSDATVKGLATRIISSLVPMIKANQGALYIAGEEQLVMQACYAYAKSKFLEHSIAFGDGVIGQCFLEKEMVYLKQVPKNFIRITSGLGEATPRTVLVMPLKVKEQVVGVLEVASFDEFKPHVIEFIEKISENIAYTFLSMQVAEQTQRLLTESQELTEQMRSQEEELKQNQEELQATQEEISRKYKHLFKELKDLNYQSRYDQLTSINLTRKRAVEYYFDIIRNQIVTFSESTMIVDAMKSFGEAFASLQSRHNDSRQATITAVTAYYNAEFIPRIQSGERKEDVLARVLPQDDVTLTLQHLFIAQNPHPTGQKHLLNHAGIDCPYGEVHQQYHPIIRSFLEKFGYYDIFLIDAKTGYMVYSVFKEIDFATCLTTGLHCDTNFGVVVRQAIESEDKSFVKLIDFQPYAPSYMAPASFIARPIWDGDEKVGVLVFQMPINKINQVLTGNEQWRADGMGDSGETFMVGDDFLMRSVSRSFVENQASYLKGLRALGYVDNVIKKIESTQTNILLERVESQAVMQALRGKTGVSVEGNAGLEKLIAYAPLSIPDVHWAIASTMDEREVSKRIEALATQQR